MERDIEKNSVRIWLTELGKAQQTGKNSGIWRYIYNLASKPRRKRIAVNMSKLQKYAAAGENIVVPGKLLGTGSLDKSINITAVEYSSGALAKLRKAKCTVVALPEMMKKESVKIII